MANPNCSSASIESGEMLDLLEEIADRLAPENSAEATAIRWAISTIDLYLKDAAPAPRFPRPGQIVLPPGA